MKIKEIKRLIKESWDEVYDDPYEAELADLAFNTQEPASPSAAKEQDLIATTIGDDIMSNIRDMIEITKQELIEQGYSEAKAEAEAKKEAAETLEIYQTMLRERFMKDDDLLLLED